MGSLVAAATDLDAVNITGVGLGAVLLALVFRTLWKQEDGWRGVLQAARDDASSSRAEASAARADASAARQDAAAARADAWEARKAEESCRRRLDLLSEKLQIVQESTHRNSKRLDDLDTGEHPSAG